MFRWLAALVFLAAIAFGVTYVAAGRGAPPALAITQPDRMVGAAGTLEVTAHAPAARLTTLTIRLEQDGTTTPLFSLAAPPEGAQVVVPEAPTGDVLTVRMPFGKQTVPQLRSGAARIVVDASRPSLFNLRTLSSSTSKDVQVRLEPPRVAVLSTHHYINHGGAEMVVYRVTPPDVASGVRVGDVEYRGYPASGAGAAAGPSVHVAFFGLLPDQDINTRIGVFARDEAGNEAVSPTFIDRVFPKPFRKSRITVDNRFLERVVPDILQHSPELKASAAPGDLLASFLKVNGDLRQMNAERISAMTANSAATRLWSGPFVQLGNSQVEAGFADQRTYVYDGRDIDRQTHLGFDLAVTSAIPVVAANAGTVLHDGWLGIYGNCVVIDHGMGVASLYGHLSSVDVKVGDRVTKGQVLGRSGMTGLAGGDHLHFTMLVHGRAVNPVEWWDAHWIEDRVERKLSVRYD